MNRNYLKDNRVVYVTPQGFKPEGEWDYDSFRDGDGVSIGDTWTGAAYTKPPVPPEITNHVSLQTKGESQFGALRALRDNPATTFTAALVATHLKMLAGVLITLLRLQLGKNDGDT